MIALTFYTQIHQNITKHISNDYVNFPNTMRNYKTCTDKFTKCHR